MLCAPALFDVAAPVKATFELMIAPPTTTASELAETGVCAWTAKAVTSIGVMVLFCEPLDPPSKPPPDELNSPST